MPAVGVGSNVKKRKRACNFAMAVAIAMMGHYWDKFQARHQVKLRGGPLIGMQMLMIVQRSMLAVGGDLAEANNKRSRTERFSSPQKKNCTDCLSEGLQLN